jgi:hypothetical protein
LAPAATTPTVIVRLDPIDPVFEMSMIELPKSRGLLDNPQKPVIGLAEGETQDDN